MLRNKNILVVLLLVVLFLSGCYHRHSTSRHAALPSYSERQLDSISFSSMHHYTNGYNFLVKVDSLYLLRQQPVEEVNGMPTDSFAVAKGNHLVVADIRIVPQDDVDSVWVLLGTEQERFGWIHESMMLPKVVPDDPISIFISTFSDVHLLIFLIVIVVISAAYFFRKILHSRGRIVHFNDIDSFYPTVLCLLVASSASLYAYIQVFAPEVWRHFYFNPTLNPFSVPFILSVFLICVWSMLIIGLAVVDDVRHRLPIGDAILYMLGLAAVCAVDYVVFSITSLYFVGYLLLVVYYLFSIRQYRRHHRQQYYCGHCGKKIDQKGRCPYCGTMNE